MWNIGLGTVKNSETDTPAYTVKTWKFGEHPGFTPQGPRNVQFINSVSKLSF